ncbi:hypothetical protein [Gallibacterium anatis]|uniref:hypothetical protein n=1 Tax=Gallibacterium anatis TaxID=750 RepID=UPI000531A026|nr:hypothetical protein [Gallibacterium anatis]KGQ63979.1 hypothetical protein IO49_09790 [Gallibacterium anatis]
MITLISLFILAIGLLGLAIGFGLIAAPFIVSLIIAAPALFLYMLIIGSILWLSEINIFLALFALAVYCYWLHIIRKYIKAKNTIN